MRWTGPALAVALAAALLAACGDARPAAVTKTSGGCSNCHGSAPSPAPPYALSGSTATTEVTVGAHQLHLRDTPVRLAIPCSECHLVPSAVDSPGHVDSGPPAEVTFGPLASLDAPPLGPGPEWNRGSATCSGVYCHGARLAAPPAQGPTWTFATEPDPGRPEVCRTCHEAPPPLPHPQSTKCASCHPETVDGNGAILVAGGKHIDGILEVVVGGGCAGCHGYPPATGAHAVHFGLTGAAGSGTYGDLAILQDRDPSYTPSTAPAVYAFGCGHCHPLDQGKHMDSTVEVELYDAAAPAGSLKAMASATAAYSGGLDGTCSGVYCHSSGQATPSWAKPYTGTAIASPAWTTGAPLGCNGCHDNPPRYPTGGPGAANANGHLDFSDDGWEWGHFLGMPGAYHGTKHNRVPTCIQSDPVTGACLVPGPDMYAAPITCQTCHADTADPGGVGASGFYWLDTTGDYHLPGGNPERLTPKWESWYQGLQCTTCHDGAGGNPVPGAGRVLPLRHVNGSRDVVFDARTGFPSPLSWPIDPAFLPTRPYFVTQAAISDPISTAAGAIFEPQPLPPSPYYSAPDLSVRLDPAGYDPATKTCSNIGCHVSGATGPLPWGRQYTWNAFPNSCCSCHSAKCF